VEKNPFVFAHSKQCSWNSQFQNFFFWFSGRYDVLSVKCFLLEVPGAVKGLDGGSSGLCKGGNPCFRDSVHCSSAGCR